MLETLYDYFVRHPEKMPSEYIEIAEKEGAPAVPPQTTYRV